MAPKRKCSAQMVVAAEEPVMAKDTVDVVSKATIVRQALQNETYQLDSKQAKLLERLAEPALSELLDNRHEFAELVVEELETVFESIEERLRNEFNAVQVQVDTLEDERSSANELLDQANQALMDLSSATIVARDAQQAAEESMMVHLNEKDAALVEQTKAAKDAELARETHRKVTEFCSGFEMALLQEEGNAVDLDAMADVLVLVPDLEESLRSAAIDAVSKPPSTRGEFDRIVLKSTEEALTKAQLTSQAALESEVARGTMAGENATAAEKSFKSDVAYIATLNHEVNSCADRVKEAKKNVSDAEVKVESLEQKAETLQTSWEAAKVKMDSFYGDLSAFKFLQSRSVEFEPPEVWSPWRPTKRVKLTVQEDPTVTTSPKQSERAGIDEAPTPLRERSQSTIQ